MIFRTSDKFEEDRETETSDSYEIWKIRCINVVEVELQDSIFRFSFFFYFFDFRRTNNGDGNGNGNGVA